MKTIKILLIVIAVCFGIAFLDGLFVWGLADGFYTLLGLVELVCIIWALKVAFKREITN